MNKWRKKNLILLGLLVSLLKFFSKLKQPFRLYNSAIISLKKWSNKFNFKFFVNKLILFITSKYRRKKLRSSNRILKIFWMKSIRNLKSLPRISKILNKLYWSIRIRKELNLQITILLPTILCSWLNILIVKNSCRKEKRL